MFGELHSDINPVLINVNTYCVWQAGAGLVPVEELVCGEGWARAEAAVWKPSAACMRLISPLNV